MHVSLFVCLAHCLLTHILQLAGEPTVLISNDQAWEGNIVEAPFMWQQDSKYYLFYSGNAYASPDYGVGYAVSDRPEGGLLQTSTATRICAQ